MPKTQYNAEGIVWDLDGTLLDSLRLYESTHTEVLQLRGMPAPTREMFVHNSHGGLIDSIREMCGVEGAALKEILEDFIQSEERHYEEPDGLFFPDALDLLSRCRAAGLKQIIVSNRPHHSDSRLGSPRNLASREPLVGLVDTVVCGDDNDFRKPDARMLDTAERDLGLGREGLLVVGDQFIDAELAYNLGASAVLVARDGQIPHLDRLPNGWRSREIVNSLSQISVTSS